MRDYGFDGFHGGDGIAHPRVPIYRGDFSDDMVEQFLSFLTGTGIKPDLPVDKQCGSNPELIGKRAEWILMHHRRVLIDFYIQRIARFWQRVTTALHAENKKVVVNTAWTRDPFEAIYRYGTDYKKFAQIGVDGFIVEAASVALETLEESESPSRYLCQFEAAALLNRGYVPEMPMRWLHGIKDTEENWNALRHAPTALESEIYGMSNLYRWTADGKIKRCQEGLMVCLADGIRQEDWRWLKEKWELGFSNLPEELMGVTLIWSDHALEKQIDDFIATRRWSTHRWLHSLIALGAPIFSVARVGDLTKVTGPILALNIHLFSKDEQKEILAYAKGPVVVIGEQVESAAKPEVQIQDGGSDPLVCSVYRAGRKFESLSTVKNERSSSAICDQDPLSWLSDLDYCNISDEFLNRCAQVLNLSANNIIVEQCVSGHAQKPLRDAKAISVSAGKTDRGVMRLLIRNDNYICVAVTINLLSHIRNIRWLNPFTAAKIISEGSRFVVKVPGRGTTVLDVEMDI